MTSDTNPICAVCETAYLGVNGRFCTVRNHYVEYAKEPPCGKKGNSDESENN